MRQYVYRKHLREPIKYLLGITAFMVLCMLYIVIIKITGSTAEENGKLLKHMGLIIVVMAATSAIMVIEFTVFYFVIFRKFKKINISLGEEEIIYNNIKGKTLIRYEDIEKLTFPSIKYTGGWVKIKYKGGKNVRLTVVLEGIGEFLKELKDILDEKGMSHTYNEKKLYSFYKTATFSDQGWDRAYSMFNKFLVIEGIASILGIIISLLFKEIHIKLLIAIVILMFPLIAFTLAEMILGRKLAKLSKVDGYEIRNRNTLIEDKTYKNVYIICSIIVVAIVIIMMII